MTRYDNPTILTTSQGKPYYNGKFYPNIPLSADDINDNNDKNMIDIKIFFMKYLFVRR
jgi:hypothetical protein